MARNISDGRQDFETLVSRNYFYVDKTKFIREWWNNGEWVSLITRPRLFGKTLTLSMVERFFSVQCEGRHDLFKGLDIYNDTEMMKLQGKYPVISLTLAGTTGPTYEEMISSVSGRIREVFQKVVDTVGLDKMDPRDAEYIRWTLSVRYDANNEEIPLSEFNIKNSLWRLSSILSYTFEGKKVIILLDDYDAPFENAYLCGYWDKAVEFFGQFYKITFKGNSYLGRALITGINEIPKQRLSSPFNNYEVYSVIVPPYGDVFGFTQEEVDKALEEYDMLDMRDEVKRWYDGCQFGRTKNMYNPYSISCAISNKKARGYWVNTGSNEIVSQMIKHGSSDLKDQLFDLMQGGSVLAKVNETINYKALRADYDTFWSLLMMCGYLKATGGEDGLRKLEIANHEVMEMMDNLVLEWFLIESDPDAHRKFIEALSACDEEGMQEHLSTLSLELIGSLDSANEKYPKAAENFYHGFALGIVASIRNRFVVISNRESGKGRYDIVLEPLDKARDNGIIIEFKNLDPEKEKNLDETCQGALRQIEEMKYDVELMEHGIPDERIAKFGIGYSSKNVLVRKKPISRD